MPPPPAAVEQRIVLRGRADRDPQRSRQARAGRASRARSGPPAMLARMNASGVAAVDQQEIGVAGPHRLRPAAKRARPLRADIRVRRAAPAICARDGARAAAGCERAQRRLDRRLRERVGRDDASRAAAIDLRLRPAARRSARRRARTPSTACAASRGSEARRAVRPGWRVPRPLDVGLVDHDQGACRRARGRCARSGSGVEQVAGRIVGRAEEHELDRWVARRRAAGPDRGAKPARARSGTSTHAGALDARRDLVHAEGRRAVQDRSRVPARQNMRDSRSIASSLPRVASSLRGGTP